MLLNRHYGFIGRDLDILQIEKRVLSRENGKRRNLLLVQGMGGAGKTALLQHLGQWWQTTGLVDEVFYFGYDKAAYTASQIMNDIARKLLNKDIPGGMAVSPQFAQFQSLDGARQQQKITQLLRSERHLLILDNLESVTGEAMAIRNTLNEAEQQALRSLLSDLLDGQTLVLLGSRGEEKWLMEDPLRKSDMYNLPGLDTESASALAERVLTDNVKDLNKRKEYRQSEALKDIITILNGYPLPLEVVLSNLSRQTPEEILAALKSGDFKIDPESKDSSPGARTKSIIRCIEYSHSNLDAGSQRLLLCLFPFTGVMNGSKEMLDNYTKYLRQESALSDIPFDRWEVLLGTAKRWGLLTEHDITGFITLQPVLPYFLKARLEKEPEGVREAIETAFRRHYDDIASLVGSLLKSKEPLEKQIGQLLVQVEYENLLTALKLALATRESISKIIKVLSEYFNNTQEHELALELYQKVAQAYEGYPAESMTYEIKYDYIGVIDYSALKQFRLKRYQEAEKSYQKAMSILESLQEIQPELRETGKASIYHQLGRVAEEQRQWQQAEQYYQKALEIFIEFKDRYSQASTYHQLGRVAQEKRQWQQAEQYYQKALEIFIEFKDRYSQASTYHNLGIVAQEQRQWQQAEQYYQKALEIFIEFKDRYSQASTYHNLGIVAQEQRQWQQAEQYYQKALEIYIEYEDRYSQASAYHQLGRVAEEQRQWQQAEQYYQKALEIKIEYKDRYSQASTFHQLGMVAQEQRQWQQAEQYYQKALEIKIEYEDRYSQAGTYHQLGMVAQEQRQWQQAEDYILKALVIFVEYKDQHSIAVCLRSLARLWKEKPDEDLVRQITEILYVSVEQARSLLETILKEEEENK